MNKVLMWGRLADEPKPVGDTVIRLRIGVREPYKTPAGEWEDRLAYFTVVCFGKTAELAHRHLHAGAGVTVEGALKNSSYEKDGQKKWSTDIVAHRLTFTDRKEATDDAPRRPRHVTEPAATHRIDDDMPF